MKNKNSSKKTTPIKRSETIKKKNNSPKKNQSDDQNQPPKPKLVNKSLTEKKIDGITDSLKTESNIENDNQDEVQYYAKTTEADKEDDNQKSTSKFKKNENVESKN